MKILAAYIPSGESDPVIEAGIAEARLRGAKLLVARHVNRAPDLGQTIPTLGARPPSPDPLDSGSGLSVTRIREEMDGLQERIVSDGIECEAVLLTGGRNHAEELLRFASDEDVDLIVIGLRRRSRVGKAILGSEAQDILLAARCPVLAVKAK